MRVLALLAYLSRSGLNPTVRGPRCGRDADRVPGYVSEGHVEDGVAIAQINGVPVAGHQGTGSITDTTIRTLLTLRGRFAPWRIVSLMRYPGEPSTHARADHANYIEVDFSAPSTPGLPVHSTASSTPHPRRCAAMARRPLPRRPPPRRPLAKRPLPKRPRRSGTS